MPYSKVIEQRNGGAGSAAGVSCPPSPVPCCTATVPARAARGICTAAEHRAGSAPRVQPGSAVHQSHSRPGARAGWASLKQTHCGFLLALPLSKPDLC